MTWAAPLSLVVDILFSDAPSSIVLESCVWTYLRLRRLMMGFWQNAVVQRETLLLLTLDGCESQPRCYFLFFLSN